MSKNKKEELTLFESDSMPPPSREVRLMDGATEGFAESVAFKIHAGGNMELVAGIAEIELTIEARRASAARGLATTLRNKLINDGYLVTSDIDHILEEFLEDEQQH